METQKRKILKSKNINITTTSKIIGKNNCIPDNSPKFATSYINDYCNTTHTKYVMLRKYNHRLFETNCNLVKQKKRHNRNIYNFTKFVTKNHSPEKKKISSSIKNSDNKNNTIILNKGNFQKYIGSLDKKEIKCLIASDLYLKKCKKKNIRSANDSIKFVNHKKINNSLAYKKQPNFILFNKKNKNLLNIRSNLNSLKKNRTKIQEILCKFNSYNKNNKNIKNYLAIPKLKNCQRKRHSICIGTSFTKFFNNNENSLKNDKNNFYVIKIPLNKKENTEISNQQQTINKKHFRNHEILIQSTNLSSTYFASDKKIITNQNIADNSKNSINKKLTELFPDNFNFGDNVETGVNEIESSKFINFELGESSKNDDRLNIKDNNEYIGILKNKNAHDYYKEYEKTAEEMELIANEIYNHSNVVSNKNVNILSRKKNLAIDIEELEDGEGIHRVK